MDKFASLLHVWKLTVSEPAGGTLKPHYKFGLRAHYMSPHYIARKFTSLSTEYQTRLAGLTVYHEDF